MTRRSKFASAAAMTAALSLAATPSFAADLPISESRSAAAADLAWSPAGETQDYHRRYRNRRGGVDAGDVLTGVLILGGIAAVASAVSNSNNNNRDERYRYPDPRYRSDPPYRTNDTNGDVRGLDRAASICVSAIERDARVRSVDSVDRDAGGWRVSGALFDGQGFTCALGADGRIQGIDYGGTARGYGADYGQGVSYGDDNQLDDDRYRSARAAVEGQGGYGYAPNAPVTSGQPSGERLPAYPGGPVEGDYGYED